MPARAPHRLPILVLAALLVAEEGGAADHPPPPPRPAELSAPAAAPEPFGPPIPPELLAQGSGEGAACRARLKERGVAFEAQPPLRAGACAAAEPLRVTALSPSLPLPAPVVMVCPMAEKLAAWAVEAVEPAAREHLGDRLKRIVVGTGYECRGQNRQSGAKLSEHAFANAADVMGFEFEKRAAIPVAPHPEGSDAARFQAAVRARACAYFTTVLGPGTDAAHADHLHVDLRARKRGGGLCQ